MIDALLLITIFIIAVIITFVVLCCYIKLLAFMAGKLRQTFNKIGEPRSDARQESCVEVCCIKCFDKAYYFLYTCVRFIRRAIKHLIWYKCIGDNSHNGKEECGNKYRNGYVKGSLPARSHLSPFGRIISKVKAGKQPNANRTVYIPYFF